jgi:hypothetical protein
MRAHAGEAIVQAYALVGTAPGTFTATTDHAKWIRVLSTCGAGEAVNDEIEASGAATTFTITVSSLTTTAVQGTASFTFDDGSMLSGTFDVPICTTSDAENTTCF